MGTGSDIHPFSFVGRALFCWRHTRCFEVRVQMRRWLLHLPFWARVWGGRRFREYMVYIHIFFLCFSSSPYSSSLISSSLRKGRTRNSSMVVRSFEWSFEWSFELFFWVSFSQFLILPRGLKSVGYGCRNVIRFSSIWLSLSLSLPNPLPLLRLPLRMTLRGWSFILLPTVPHHHRFYK